MISIYNHDINPLFLGLPASKIPGDRVKTVERIESFQTKVLPAEWAEYTLHIQVGGPSDRDGVQRARRIYQNLYLTDYIVDEHGIYDGKKSPREIIGIWHSVTLSSPADFWFTRVSR